MVPECCKAVVGRPQSAVAVQKQQADRRAWDER